MTSMPSEASSSIFSASLIPGRRSLSFPARYSMPDVLKKRLTGRPLAAIHFASSPAAGRSSTMLRKRYAIPRSFRNSSALRQVEHFG
ncbi:MAG: hypothetical protein V8T86_17565 [Victivallis sp.]